MRFVITTAALLFATCCFAQQQNVYFFKNDGSFVDMKDSADYIRIVSAPDSSSKLYNVVEYYKSGKKKLIGKSTTVYPVNFVGDLISYFENGRRKTIEAYKDGMHSGSMFEYYPNGVLHLYTEYTDSLKFHRRSTSNSIREAYDSLGTATLKDGNGIYAIYDKDFTRVAEEGPIKNGVKDGLWKGFDKEQNTTFEEKYEAGILISGKAIHEGQTNTYTKARITKPGFPGGDRALGAFIGKRIRYPQNDRERGVQGTVMIKFTVEKDGTLTDIHVVKSVSPGLDNEALNALKNSPIWTPGTMYGLPARVSYTMPIAFTLAVR